MKKKIICLCLVFLSFAFADVVEIKDEKHLSKEINNSNSLVFLDCYSSWCQPCKKLTPLFELWSKKFSSKGKFLKANLDTLQDLPNTYKISSMPTLLIFDNGGNLKDRKVGLVEIENYFNTFK
jgi:thioredoxin